MDLFSLFDSVASLFTADFWGRAPERAVSFLNALRPYSTVLSLLFLTGIVYCFFRIEQIFEETKHVDHEPHEGHGHTEAAPQSIAEARWQKVLKHLDSEKESDWRLAVLEADILLSEMLENMGYVGEGVGEKMRAIEKSDFTTLDQAWEAHAVRNRIAHEGVTFSLTEREARRVIMLYEQVFREFKYI